MTLDEAKALLEGTLRHTLIDKAFSDAEVLWEGPDGEIVAEGYYSAHRPENDSIWFGTGEVGFSGAEARGLRYLGRTGKTERNDSMDDEVN